MWGEKARREGAPLFGPIRSINKEIMTIWSLQRTWSVCVHLYDLLDVLGLVHERHLCHPLDVLSGFPVVADLPRLA